MFYSINPETFRIDGIDSRKLIQDKEFNQIDKRKIRISTYFNLTLQGFQNLPVTALYFGNPPEHKTVCEIKAFPLSFVLEINPTGICQAADITSFFDYSYDQETDILLQLPAKETNTPFPLDYRTKD